MFVGRDRTGLFLLVSAQSVYGVEMLSEAELQTIISTSNLERAAHFYGNILGLRSTGSSHGALVYVVGGGRLLVSPVPATRPSEHTVLGFRVDDLPAAIGKLKAQGVALEQFPNFAQDGDRVLNLPGGDRVAWFRDPDGNLLSIVQYARR